MTIQAVIADAFGSSAMLAALWCGMKRKRGWKSCLDLVHIA
jgi:hypothetical protein